ncbi:MAG: hypothetical protein ABFD81_01015 [Syntrophaceae bacterium]
MFFHHVRHPSEMAEPEINAFLTHLAVKEKLVGWVERSVTRRTDRGSIVMYWTSLSATWAMSSAPESPSACPWS